MLQFTTLVLVSLADLFIISVVFQELEKRREELEALLLAERSELV
jgi:hypothetical protein